MHHGKEFRTHFRSCKFIKSAEMKTHPASGLPLGAVHTSGAETAPETTEHTRLARSTIYPHCCVKESRRMPTKDL